MMYSVLARGNRLCLFSGHSKRSLPHFTRFFIGAAPLESYTLNKSYPKLLVETNNNVFTFRRKSQ